MIQYISYKIVYPPLTVQFKMAQSLRDSEKNKKILLIAIILEERFFQSIIKNF